MTNGGGIRLRATLLRPPERVGGDAGGSLIRYDLNAPRRTIAQAPEVAPLGRTLPPWLVPLVLYLLALSPLLIDLGGRPATAYNWEIATARGVWDFLANPRLAHFAPADGLMTDSGNTPLVVLPIVLAWRLLGVGLLPMRLPIALLAALAVPLCWLVGRRLVGTPAATVGALLLTLSPVFWLYGRTATNVGLSLVPALIAIWLLARAVESPTAARVLPFQLALLINGWAYAPLRFLWPLAVVAFGVEFLWRRGSRRRFAGAALLTAVVLPLFLLLVGGWQAREAGTVWAPQPLETVRAYYNGRGEQVFAPDSGLDGLAGIAPVVARNGAALLALFFDRDTRPTLLDYWNPHGRLQPLLLVPFVLVGLGWALWRAMRQPAARLLLILLAGFTLPIMLTSNVHVGRLIYAVPLLALLAGSGLIVAADGLGWAVRRVAAAAMRGRIRLAAPGWLRRHGWRVALGVAVLLLVAVSGLREYTVENPQGGMLVGEQTLRARAPELAATGRAAVILTNLAPTGLAPEDPGQEIYALVGYRLNLDRTYRFVDLARQPLPETPDPRPLALLGADPNLVLDRGALCGAVFYAPGELLPALEARTARLGCATPPEVTLLLR